MNASLSLLRRQFKAVDENRDGFLDREEVLDALTSQLGPADAKVLTDLIFASATGADEDGNDKISLKELQAWYSRQEQVFEEERKQQQAGSSSSSSSSSGGGGGSGSGSGGALAKVSAKSIPEAIALAKQQKKLVYAHVGRETCGAC